MIDILEHKNHRDFMWNLTNMVIIEIVDNSVDDASCSSKQSNMPGATLCYGNIGHDHGAIRWVLPSL